MAKKSLTTGFTGDAAPEKSVGAKARATVSRIKDETGMVAAHAADHPGVTGSAVAIVGLLGLAIGYALGVSSTSRSHGGYL